MAGAANGRHAIAWAEPLAVLAGGALGTALRLGTDTLLGHEPATLVVNTVGCFVLALLVARVWARAPRWLRGGLGAGLLGAFTTFSAVAASVVEFGSRGDWLPAAGYLAVSLVLGLAAAAAGLLLGHRPPLDLVDE